MQYIISFLEGIITFVSPCLLPMLPIYVSYFAGGGEKSTRRIIKNALGFILGFTTVFILLGALAGIIGKLLLKYSTIINIVSGIIIILFGLYFLGFFKLTFFKGTSFSKTNNLGFLSSLIFGIVFSIGWTPCVGAFLGSALLLAATQGSIMQGVLMLIFYSIGLGIPFFISALLIDKLKSTFAFIKRNYKIINIMSGIFLIIIGVLIAIGLFEKFLTMLS